MKILRILLILTAFVSLADRDQARADDIPIETFFGDYVGQTISVVGGEMKKRDLSVSIKPNDTAFTIDWTAITQKSSGKIKRKHYSIDFHPTKRKNIFSSAMQTNMFGHRQALDPLKGDPYVWARIVGATLTVYALLISDGGGYEMQVYDRTLTDDGLHLKFSRVRDGETPRLIEGTVIKSSE
ncbi:MAG: hypothetical protein ACE5FE_04600 [Acidiferrobacterales bacterium]